MTPECARLRVQQRVRDLVIDREEPSWCLDEESWHCIRITSGVYGGNKTKQEAETQIEKSKYF